MWSAQAQAERLTLLVADNKVGYFGVCLKWRSPSSWRRMLLTRPP